MMIPIFSSTELDIPFFHSKYKSPQLQFAKVGCKHNFPFIYLRQTPLWPVCEDSAASE